MIFSKVLEVGGGRTAFYSLTVTLKSVLHLLLLSPVILRRAALCDSHTPFPQVENLYSVDADATTVGPSLPCSFSWFSEGTSALGVHDDLLIRHWYFRGNHSFLSSNDFSNLCSQGSHFSLGYLEFIFNRLSSSDLFIEDFWLRAYPRKVFCHLLTRMVTWVGKNLSFTSRYSMSYQLLLHFIF